MLKIGPLSWGCEKDSPSLVILCFFVYKTVESLLQSANRLHVYSTICSAIVNETTYGNLCNRKEQFRPVLTDNTSRSLWSNVMGLDADNVEIFSRAVDKETEVQRLSGNYLIAYRILFNLPAMVTCLLYGSVSNRIGRKWAMVIPCCGSVMACSWFAASLHPRLRPIPEAITLILMGALSYGICGKSSAMSMGANSYITDVSSTEERTKLLGRLMGVNFFGLCIGAGLLAVFSRFHGIAAILIFVTTCDGLLIIIVIFFVRESLKQPAELSILNTKPIGPGLTVDDSEQRNGTDSHNCFIKFWSSIRESYRFLFSQKVNNLRAVLPFLFGSVLFNQLTKSGEQDAILLFVTNRPFRWTAEWYGYYLTVYYGCMAILLTVILPLIESKLAPRDSTLIVIGLCFKIARLLCMSFTSSTVLMFISAVGGSVAGFISSGTRSLISKLVQGKDVGASFALVSCMETVANLGGGTLFTSVYNLTLTVFPGTVFLIDTILHVGVLCGFLWLRHHVQTEDSQCGLSE
ncbi:Proton-coupled folate transporter [Fasciola hepatica]|uniref:Proton-coupled folate transporter n=1 Tax=Fasciola hepatica TaxID=6192 RepID=A0A2H1CVA1_FASHE|nr:Proton-coupled folate transporter [Fasciola hepatica]